MWPKIENARALRGFRGPKTEPVQVLPKEEKYLLRVLLEKLSSPQVCIKLNLLTQLNEEIIGIAEVDLEGGGDLTRGTDDPPPTRTLEIIEDETTHREADQGAEEEIDISEDIDRHWLY